MARHLAKISIANLGREAEAELHARAMYMGDLELRGRHAGPDTLAAESARVMAARLHSAPALDPIGGAR